jgi:hypothetical protein
MRITDQLERISLGAFFHFGKFVTISDIDQRGRCEGWIFPSPRFTQATSGFVICF